MEATMQAMMQQLHAQQQVQNQLITKLMAVGGESGGGSGDGSGGGGTREVLFGKGLVMMDKFSGGETGWNEWSRHFKTIVQTKSEAAGETLIYVKVVGKTEKEVMDWKDAVESKKDDAKKKADDELDTEVVVGNKVKAVEGKIQGFRKSVEGIIQVAEVEDGR